MLLGMVNQVSLSGEGPDTCGTGPARATVGSGYAVRSGSRERAAYSGYGVGRLSSKRCTVATMAKPNGGKVDAVRRVGIGVGLVGWVDTITVSEIIVA